jgi:hypothetical protein
MICLSNGEQTARYTTNKLLPAEMNVHSLHRLTSCGEGYTAAVTPYGPRGSRPNAYVTSTSIVKLKSHAY